MAGGGEACGGRYETGGAEADGVGAAAGGAGVGAPGGADAVDGIVGSTGGAHDGDGSVGAAGGLGTAGDGSVGAAGGLGAAGGVGAALGWGLTDPSGGKLLVAESSTGVPEDGGRVSASSLAGSVLSAGSSGPSPVGPLERGTHAGMAGCSSVVGSCSSLIRSPNHVEPRSSPGVTPQTGPHRPSTSFDAPWKTKVILPTETFVPDVKVNGSRGRSGVQVWAAGLHTNEPLVDPRST